MKLPILHPLFYSAVILSGLQVSGCQPQAPASEASKGVTSSARVSIAKEGDAFKIMRDGKPYFIKGAGGDGDRKLLVSLGGNTIRTWGADDLGKVLDEAQSQGLTVVAGIWLGHREYFSYQDAKKVQDQFEMCKKIVQKHKDHPALLMWAFGNEAEGDGKDPDVYKAIEALAAMSHKEDPNHPAITVIAEIGDNKLESIQKYCPSLDAVGVNSYGGGPSLPERYKKVGFQKPYMLTEFGPPGPWEAEKTAWAAAREMTSTAKAQWTAKSYKANVIDNKNLCLGSFAFLWGHKTEGTPTWFGMMLEDGSRLAAVDTIAALWADKPVKIECPTLSEITIDGSGELEPGKTITATVTADSPQTNVEWQLIRELHKSTEDPNQAVKAEVIEGAVKGKGSKVTVTMPTKGGALRLMATARNAHGAATSNIPLMARPKVEVATNAPKGKLPLVVYSEGADPMPFVPTGWMGDSGSMRLSTTATDKPHSGSTCILFTFLNSANWGGIAWQYPANDWGDKPESINLNGAKKLTFWMRGASGGEKIKVQFGILGPEKTYHDSGTGTTEVVLTKDWKQYSIDLAGKDLTKIKTGFVFTVAGIGHPQSIFMDDIRYE